MANIDFPDGNTRFSTPKINSLHKKLGDNNLIGFHYNYYYYACHPAMCSVVLKKTKEQRVKNSPFPDGNTRFSTPKINSLHKKLGDNNLTGFHYNYYYYACHPAMCSVVLKKTKEQRVKNSPFH